ncbi:MAG: AsmA family protein, partial [Usitatibacteraceae bacterium]
ISHLVVEAAGLDVAQGLGLLFTHDNALPVQCGVADLVAKDGVFRPRAMVVDTADSAIWIDGSLSLATEALDLRAVVSPKDFSPLTLRTPLLVRGTFAAPKVSIEKGPLGKTLATSFLLALINPLAALIPLIDRGDADAAKSGNVGCRNLLQRGEAQRTAAARIR